MKRKDIEAKVIEVIDAGDYTNVSKEEIEPSHSFMDDLGLDSLDMSELAQEMEDIFELTLDYEDLESMKTVEDAVDYLAKQLGIEK